MNVQINKQKIIYDEQARMNQPKDEQAQGRTEFGMNTVRCQRSYVLSLQYNDIANRGISS